MSYVYEHRARGPEELNPGDIVLTKVPAKSRLGRDNACVIRITPAAKLAVLELCNLTGWNVKTVASSLITQAARACVIAEEEEA